MLVRGQPPRGLLFYRNPGNSERGDKIQGIAKRHQVICGDTAKPLPSLSWYNEALIFCL